MAVTTEIDHTAHGTQPKFVLGRRPGLDGVRAVAIIMVVLCHTTQFLYFSHWFDLGSNGVEVFFGLSGFLITSLLVEEFQKRRHIDLVAFYQRRFLRLMPALVVLVVVTTVWNLSYEHGLFSIDWKGGLYTIGYVSNWARVENWPLPQLLDHTWSLGVEEQFYIVWPLLLLLVIRWRGLGAAAMVAVAVGVIGTIVAQGISVHDPAVAGLLYFEPELHVFALLGGAASAMALYGGLRLPPWIGKAGLLCLVLVALTTLPVTWFPDPLSGWSLDAAIIVFVLGCLETGTWLYWLMSRGPVRWLGRISYSLYLWHYPVFIVMVNDAPHLRSFDKLLIAYPVSVVLACASYYLVERPFLRLRRRRVRVDESAAATIVAADPAPA